MLLESLNSVSLAWVPYLKRSYSTTFFKDVFLRSGNDIAGILLSTIYELLESRAKEAEKYVQRSKGAKLILKIAGAVRLNVETVDPPDQATATITGKEVIVSHELLEKPHATIKGKSNVVKDLIASTKEEDISKSAESFEAAEKRGDVSIESHGIKGKLIVSRVRKMLLD